MLAVNFSSLLINESMNTTGLRFSLHHNFVILTSTFDGELVRVRVGITLFEVMLQSITQHQSPLTNIELNFVASILLSNEICEGIGIGTLGSKVVVRGDGSHGVVESYERIIGASGGISAPPVQVIQLSSSSSSCRKSRGNVLG